MTRPPATEQDMTFPDIPTPSEAPTRPPGRTPAQGGAAISEQLVRDYLQDRRSERRWWVFFRLTWL